MSGWNNELGRILLMRNNRGGWNKQGGWTFSSKQLHGLGEMFSLESFRQSIHSSGSQ